MTTNYMQANFEAVLEKYGHVVWLQRRSQGDGKITYLDKLEKHRVRYSINSSRSLMGRTQEQGEGILATSEKVYYFKINAHPFDGDRIYDYDEVSKIRTIWTVDTSIPMRGIEGEIIYYAVGVTRTSPN